MDIDKSFTKILKRLLSTGSPGSFAVREAAFLTEVAKDWGTRTFTPLEMLGAGKLARYFRLERNDNVRQAFVNSAHLGGDGTAPILVYYRPRKRFYVAYIPPSPLHQALTKQFPPFGFPIRPDKLAGPNPKSWWNTWTVAAQEAFIEGLKNWDGPVPPVELQYDPLKREYALGDRSGAVVQRLGEFFVAHSEPIERRSSHPAVYIEMSARERKEKQFAEAAERYRQQLRGQQDQASTPTTTEAGTSSSKETRAEPTTATPSSAAKAFQSMSGTPESGPEIGDELLKAGIDLATDSFNWALNILGPPPSIVSIEQSLEPSPLSPVGGFK